MLKKIASAIALLGVGGLAHAQSSVQIYGIMDTAVETMNNVGATKSNLTRMPNLTGSVPSRLGFRGREDLGGGLSASFTLEMGIGPDSGALNQGGRGFGRQSFVSLNGPWGSLGLGRQYTMLFWSVLDADVIGRKDDVADWNDFLREHLGHFPADHMMNERMFVELVGPPPPTPLKSASLVPAHARHCPTLLLL